MRKAASGEGLTLGELSEILAALGPDADAGQVEGLGPPVHCAAPRIAGDIDLRISSVSDCVLVSAEISPAGIIHLVSHCWTSCMKLLSKGIMCRGYIARGRICHTPQFQMGPGLIDVVDREKRVSVFKEESEEGSTPFIEISGDVVQYVERHGDRYVKEMFFQLVRMDGDVAAIFPFRVLDCRCSQGRVRAPRGPGQEHASPRNVENSIRRIKARLNRHIDPSDPEARRKANYYIRMLDAQLAALRRSARD